MDYRQESLPDSFKFYDPILLIIQEQISDERKEFFYTKNQINHNYYKGKGLKAQLYEGFFGPDDATKLTFKYKYVCAKEHNQINHYTSEHTMNLYRSKYIMIEDDID